MMQREGSSLISKQKLVLSCELWSSLSPPLCQLLLLQLFFVFGQLIISFVIASYSSFVCVYLATSSTQHFKKNIIMRTQKSVFEITTQRIYNFFKVFLCCCCCRLSCQEEEEDDCTQLFSLRRKVHRTKQKNQEEPHPVYIAN